MDATLEYFKDHLWIGVNHLSIFPISKNVKTDNKILVVDSFIQWTCTQWLLQNLPQECTCIL